MSSYTDTYITVDTAGITVRWYSFPFGTKRIPWAHVLRARRRVMGPFTGQWRIWGTGDFTHWYHLDLERPGRDVSFALDVSESRIVPVLTPADPAAFARALEAHGVKPVHD